MEHFETAQTETAATIPTDTVPTVDGDTKSVAVSESPSDLQNDGFVLPVKFNKQEYQLSLEDATVYAQKGMKYTSLEPLLTRLNDLAHANGQSPAAFVDALCGKTVDVNERLADEFCRLQEECPEVDSFDQLPDEVVQTALDRGIPLYYAYLRHQAAEYRRIRTATATTQAAAQASAGGQHSETRGMPDPTVEAMVRGVWG